MKTVAYSYDVLPWWVLPAAFRPPGLSGSVFALLATTNGPVPGASGVRSPRGALPRDRVGPQTDDHQLVVLLDQLHDDKQDRPFMHSRSYFIEGLFTFTVLRST